MRSTSCRDIAQRLLDCCIAGHPPRELPRVLAEEACGQALFGILVEGLADRFEPALCDIYARLFSQAIAYATEGIDPASLVAHYQRVRRPRPIPGEPRKICVLSRVTLGADVVVTSALLDAARRRFPEASILFVGPSKNFELFAGDPKIRHAPVAYRRGGLRERLAVWQELKTLLTDDDCIVIDPDSRLTQLGLLPVCPEERYHLFESRAYGGDTDRPLSELTAAWAAETFGVTGAKPYVALSPGDPIEGPPPSANGPSAPYIAVSLGVGENPAKRLPAPFESELLSVLAETGLGLCVDTGAGGEEAERVSRAVERSGVQPALWRGSFAGFAALIAGSRLYVGYDSAGQHVAAACGIPLISVFAGFAAPRMFERWRPVGENCHVIRVDPPEAADTVLATVRLVLQDLRTVL